MTDNKANSNFLILKRIHYHCRNPQWRVKIKKIKMTDFSKRYGQWALVAGAAEGIGAAFCEELATRGMNLIMVDVKGAEMELLATDLEGNYSISVRRLLLDLSHYDAAETMIAIMKELDCRLLVYNAAYSRVKPFLEAGPGELDMYLDVNARTPLKLVHEFAGFLKEAGKPGGILLMSSLAGLWGTSLVAAYSGTKAFNLALAEALSHELKPHKINVSVVCAGATATPGYLGTNPSYGFIRPSVMEPGRVASIALNHLGRKTLIIPGISNKLTYFLLTRIFPRSVSANLVNLTMARTYKKFQIPNNQ
jgi:short-subunit dehydrogenase